MNQSWSVRLVTIMTGFVLTVSSNAVDDITITQTDVQEFDGPTISPSQNEIILNKGQNYTLSCKGNNPLQFKQQELSEEVVGSFYMTQRNVSSSDLEYKYEIALDLYNIDQFTVGYYACFDNTVNSSDVLNKVTEELNNTAHISYIYIYVNDSENLFAPMRQIVTARSGSKVVIECRPTTPDIKVKLTAPQSNKTPEYIKFSTKIGFLVKVHRTYKCEGRRGNESSSKSITIMDTLPPQPKIIGGSRYFLEGETFSLNCTVAYQTNSAVMLSWDYPRIIKDSVFSETNAHAVTDGILFNNITVANATKEAAGLYTCISKNANQKPAKESFTKEYLEEPLMKLIAGSSKKTETRQKVMRLQSILDDYPPAKVFFLKNNKEVPSNKTKYSLTRSSTGSVVLTIRDLKLIDTANYTIVASNRYNTTNVTFDLRFIDHPIVDFGPETDKKYLENTKATLRCEAIGYPLPNITWSFSGDREWTTVGSTEVLSVYKVGSLLSVPVRISGNITCTASNSEGSASAIRRFFVYEMPDGFGIKNIDNTWFSENENISLKCLASKYDFVNVSWMRNDEELDEFVEFSENAFSFVAKLKIPRISLNQAGNYTCYGNRLDGSEEMQTISLTVAASRPPIINDSNIDKDEEVYYFQPVQLTCQADAVPPPLIEWHKDGEPLANDANVEIIMNYLDHSIVNSTVEIKKMQEENKGKYECIARSAGRVQRKFYNLLLKEKSTYKATYLSIIGVIIFVLIILIVYLAWKIRKEKQFRKELAAAGLLNFKEGATGGLNPELGIDEQAELLPYDEKFEFPPEKLILGKQLGAGAFGVVYKAEARGIINAEETTTVAVKMVKKTADNMYIKALASELKIMVHMGKHINIVNLLGACTKNVGKRELIVIVEYCKFGNIHNYMQKHREVFIDQLTDNKEKTLGKINRGYSSSSGNSGMHSDYFGSNHTQETDHTFLNTANTNRSGRKDNQNQQVEIVKASETGYVQPEWRSNYESDYSFDGRNPRPLCSRDLLAWAFQIARGMEYLASRKVLHGDLAARNILLAEDNIVKICDFGLARSIYKNDEYQKKENSPLPVKWLAIECMTDRIFSTQSDVWSFGIVLWELFSLAKTPYPNVSPPSLLQWLSEGHRLEKPLYADDKLYGVMRRCWEQKPTARPSFTQLQEMLGSFLEDNVRNHYVDLNSACMDMNVKREGQEDYLAMVCAPDYNNMVTPSPHHYVNDTRSFFPPTPTQLLHDDEGYLQMSPTTNQTIFSPRAQGTKFDFDPRKLNPRVSEASSCGSELTPMLTLNNLPARSGSESDHEGGSPYLRMCPRIDEETDEVFQTKQNNARNIHDAAVTNPTYITFDIDVEKKPHGVNDYINVSAPNGLVK